MWANHCHSFIFLKIQVKNIDSFPLLLSLSPLLARLPRTPNILLYQKSRSKQEGVTPTPSLFSLTIPPSNHMRDWEKNCFETRLSKSLLKSGYLAHIKHTKSNWILFNIFTQISNKWFNFGWRLTQDHSRYKDWTETAWKEKIQGHVLLILLTHLSYSFFCFPLFS